MIKDRESILKSRWLRPFAHLLGHPSLWHLNRRSVPRGLALGLFSAFILPIGQFALAALLAIPVRANVPLAAAATLVTNPFTFPPIYYAAYRVGQALLFEPAADSASNVDTSFGVQLLQVSGPTALGLVLFAVSAAVAGYLLGSAWWHFRIMQRWRNRRGRAG
ncbi:MAG: DUF2062 domain-containing protein [Sphingomicrobium sp.]